MERQKPSTKNKTPTMTVITTPSPSPDECQSCLEKEIYKRCFTCQASLCLYCWEDETDDDGQCQICQSRRGRKNYG